MNHTCSNAIKSQLNPSDSLQGVGFPVYTYADVILTELDIVVVPATIATVNLHR